MRIYYARPFPNQEFTCWITAESGAPFACTKGAMLAGLDERFVYEVTDLEDYDLDDLPIKPTSDKFLVHIEPVFIHEDRQLAQDVARIAGWDVEEMLNDNHFVWLVESFNNSFYVETLEDELKFSFMEHKNYVDLVVRKVK